MSSTALADRLEAVAAELRAYPTSTDALRLLQGLSNAIDAEKVVLVAEVDEHRDFEAEGCSSLKNWLRDQLHLDGRQAGQLVRSSRTLRDMPDLESLATEGAVSLDHVDAFTYAAKHIEPMVVEQCMNPLLDLATHAAPTTVRQAVKKLRATAHPDDLDEAWKGMDQHDLKVSVVGDGVAVTGFLPFDTGTKLKTLLQSLSAPTCAEDDRPVSIRRVTALDALLSSVLASGLPQDKGVRPHITLAADLEDLAHNPETATAELAGFGTIGPTRHTPPTKSRRQPTRRHLRRTRLPRTRRPRPPHRVLVRRRPHRPRQPHRALSEMSRSGAPGVLHHRPRHAPDPPHPAHPTHQRPSHPSRLTSTALSRVARRETCCSNGGGGAQPARRGLLDHLDVETARANDDLEAQEVEEERPPPVPPELAQLVVRVVGGVARLGRPVGHHRVDESHPRRRAVVRRRGQHQRQGRDGDEGVGEVLDAEVVGVRLAAVGQEEVGRSPLAAASASDPGSTPVTSVRGSAGCAGPDERGAGQPARSGG